MEYFYFHNCPYETVWKDNSRRRQEQISTYDLIRTYGSDYRVIFVGDAAMSPYEIVAPGGSVEHWNQEAGRVWMARLLDHFHKVAWLNPVPDRHWQHSHSTQLIRQLICDRMFPMTLSGLESATRELSR